MTIKQNHSVVHANIESSLLLNFQLKEPAGPAKPTKYHYYPHNQHIYLLPECAIQQVSPAFNY